MMRSSWLWFGISAIITGISLVLTILYGFPFLFFFALPPLLLGKQSKKGLDKESKAIYCPNCGYKFSGFECYCPICGLER
ncbi:MAG: hypothetical protein ACTSYD_07285 [Candidatus Heimdallarchaeaceae archaeon]